MSQYTTRTDFGPLFKAALPPVARRSDPATSHEAAREVEPRRGTQCAAILARLRVGPATNAELAGIALKYTSRLSDLRALGYSIRATPVADGVVSYRLVEGAQ